MRVGRGTNCTWPAPSKSTPFWDKATTAAPGGSNGTGHSTCKSFRRVPVTDADTVSAAASASTVNRHRNTSVDTADRSCTTTPGSEDASAGSTDGVTPTTSTGGVYKNPRSAAASVQSAPPFTDNDSVAKPSTPGGVVHARERPPTATSASTPAAGNPANRQRVDPGTNPYPVTVTAVPPTDGPNTGENADATTTAWYSNTPASNTSPPFTVMVTGTAPTALAGGATHTAVSAATNDAGAAAPPKLHASVSNGCNRCPGTVTTVPPTTDPAAGDGCPAVARPTYVKLPSRVGAEKSTPLLDTATATARSPTVDGGVTHCTAAGDSQVAGTSVPASPPSPPNRHTNSTDDSNSEPATVTVVPPVSAPTAGTTPVTRAGATYLNNADVDEKSWPFDDTCTDTVPSVAAGGVTQRISVSDTTSAGTWDAPNKQAAPAPAPTAASASTPEAVKPEPVSTSAVPPTDGPLAGENPVNLGAGMNVYATSLVTSWPLNVRATREVAGAPWRGEKHCTSLADTNRAGTSTASLPSPAVNRHSKLDVA